MCAKLFIFLASKMPALRQTFGLYKKSRALSTCVRAPTCIVDARQLLAVSLLASTCRASTMQVGAQHDKEMHGNYLHHLSTPIAVHLLVVPLAPDPSGQHKRKVTQIEDL